MIKKGYADLPLHPGKCPAWLFGRMKKLSGVVSELIIDEYGVREFLERVSNPYFFQSLGCVIGFDWHSSGLTVTTTAALKESLNEKNIGVNVAGGKGKTSRKAPEEIRGFGKKFGLSTEKIDKMVYNSRMSAKVDNSLVQDNYNLYHHTFFLSEKGKWAVVQQGMNNENSYARRYHWLSSNFKDFVEEPHNAICSEKKHDKVLNMTAKGSKEARKISIDVVNDGIFERFFRNTRQKTLTEFYSEFKHFKMPERHYIRFQKEINIKMLRIARDYQPKTYEELIAIRGVGSKSIRSLALISELVYGKRASWKDPVKYSFAHGGKDGIPYPVNREVYDSSVNFLREAIKQAKIGEKDKIYALRRLRGIY